jgi:uncharacterized protein YecE (DUF72 family)
MDLFLGCPIWAYKGWVGSFYPKGTKQSDYLYEYARRLNAVEGNTTFYAVPAADTLHRWTAETPETFQFCPKLPRTVSHTGVLLDHQEEARQFLKIMRQLGSRLGPLFLQLPPRYPPSQLPDLRTFLANWHPDARLAVEVRHTDWFDVTHHETLNSVLADHNVARVIIDTRPIQDLRGDRILEGSVYKRLLEARQRKPHLPIHVGPTTDFAFLRYIGHPEHARNEPFLVEWSQQIAGWLEKGISAYVFCHCPDERLDPWLCREFHRRVSERVSLPPLPWDDVDPKTEIQPPLF